ncbi:MAG: hypothetical protein RRA92_08315 [Gemmatimonadota bacterium]|nr:hypothetical protein [Gemmatimonadota bacterium]
MKPICLSIVHLFFDKLLTISAPPGILGRRLEPVEDQMRGHAWGPVLVLLVMLGLIVVTSLEAGESLHGGAPPAATATRGLDVEALVDAALDAALLGGMDVSHRSEPWEATPLPL